LPTGENGVGTSSLGKIFIKHRRQADKNIIFVDFFAFHYYTGRRFYD
jgi:hypothetical protein